MSVELVKEEVQFDLVAALFGGPSAALSRVVYSLVGVSGVVVALTSLAMGPSTRAAGYHRDATAVPAR